MRKNILLILSFFLLLYPAIGSATTVESLSPTVGYADMDGMKVTVTYKDSSGDWTSDTETWGVLGGYTNTSGVIGTNWSLTFAGDDTYPMPTTNPWSFTTSNSLGIKSIEICSLPGDVVFDIFGNTNSSTDYFTEGSAFGYWTPNNLDSNGHAVDLYNNEGSYTFGGADATWKFSDPVNIAGQATAGYTDLSSGALTPDVYTTLKIDFDSPSSVTAFDFYLDTDQVVPEPATLFLFGLGLLGMCGVLRKRIKTV